MSQLTPEKPVYYCGVDGSLSCTRIVVIKKGNPADVAENDVYRHWKVTKGTNLEFFSNEENLSIIERGINQLMAEVTGTMTNEEKKIMEEKFSATMTDKEKKDLEEKKNKVSPVEWKSVAEIKRVVIVFAQNNDKKMKAFQTALFTRNSKAKFCEVVQVMPEIDAVAMAHFQNDEEGIALHCGVDTFCRFKKALYPIDVPNTVESHSTGGAYWIARTALQMVIEETERCEAKRWQKTNFIKELFQEFVFKGVDTTYEMNQELFNLKFKHRLAKITEILAELPYKEENDYMKLYWEKAKIVYEEYRKNKDSTGVLKDEKDEERFMFEDFDDAMAYRMGCDDEIKREYERKFIQYDVVRELFFRAGEHLGNLVSQTLSRRDSKAQKHCTSSGVPSEMGSDIESNGTTTPPEPATEKPVKARKSTVSEMSKLSFDDEMKKKTSTKIVLCGRMFDSMELLENGLLEGLSKYKNHNQVRFYRMCDEPAVIAAVCAAGEDGGVVFDEPELLSKVWLGRDAEVELKYKSMKDRIKEATERLHEMQAMNKTAA